MALLKELNLFKAIDEPGLPGIDVYRRAYDGYKAVEKVVGGKMAPTSSSISSRRRACGAAAAPASRPGMKWSFVPKDSPKPRYLVVNADESEPGHVQGSRADGARTRTS